MRSKTDFQIFYAKEINPSIEALEEQRLAIISQYSFKAYKRNLKWMGIVSMLLVIISFAMPDKIPQQVGFGLAITALYAIVRGIYLFVKRNKSFKPLKQSYKQTVIPKIIAFVNDQLKYAPEDGLTLNEFRSGGLFEKSTRYKSEDLVHGDLGSFAIRMSDIEATRTQSTGKSSSQVDVFRGWYSISKMQGPFSSEILIKPTNALSNALGDLARKFLGDQMIDSISQKIGFNDFVTKDVEFDKHYRVRCQTIEVAQALLTPSFTQMIMTFTREVPVPVRFGFLNNEVHVAFSGVNLFESHVQTSFIEKDISSVYFNYLNLSVGISEAVLAVG